MKPASKKELSQFAEFFKAHGVVLARPRLIDEFGNAQLPTAPPESSVVSEYIVADDGRFAWWGAFDNREHVGLVTDVEGEDTWMKARIWVSDETSLWIEFEPVIFDVEQAEVDKWAEFIGPDGRADIMLKLDGRLKGA